MYRIDIKVCVEYKMHGLWQKISLFTIKIYDMDILKDADDINVYPCPR